MVYIIKFINSVPLGHTIDDNEIKRTTPFTLSPFNCYINTVY